MSAMDMVTIQTFDNYFNANIQLTRLRASGIECYLKDEYTVTIDPLLSAQQKKELFPLKQVMLQ
jgi:hypothetical protein